jgi:hypothetical protein
MREIDLLISFKLFLNDKMEAEKTIIFKIDRHLSGKEEINDDIPKAVHALCVKHGIKFLDVFDHAQNMYKPKEGKKDDKV